MPLDDINSNSAERITEIREYLDFISTLIPHAPISTPKYLNAAKGLVFVQLYGVIEFTITKTVEKSIECINQEGIKLSDIKPLLLSLALSPELDSIFQTSKKKWDARAMLFKKIEEDDVTNIISSLMPTNGENIQSRQLESIWNIFCLTDPIVHDVSFKGRLLDIVTNRINIAHGNLPASDIGSRVTVADLNTRISDVSAFCSYVIGVFEDYISQKRFLKAN